MFKKIFFLIVILLGSVVVYAGQEPPAPVKSGQVSALSGPGPPGPPGLAIGGELILLLSVGLLFGFYVIYTSVIKKKRSI